MRHVAIGRRRQRGWAGIVMLLLALVVVGVVVRSMVKQMGLADDSPGVAVTRDATAAPRSDTTQGAAPASQGSAMDRAHAVQEQVLRQGARADEQLKAGDR